MGTGTGRLPCCNDTPTDVMVVLPVLVVAGVRLTALATATSLGDDSATDRVRAASRVGLNR